MPEPILIIGAGLTGLACAHDLGEDCAIFEASDRVGGAACTVERDGFLFDCTGHWLHLRDPAIRSWVERLMPGELVRIERRAAVFSHGVYTPYPFQAHTFGLPVEVVADCVLGFFKARAAAPVAAPPRTFEDYILQCLGDGIARHFMIPYNTKLWTVPPSEMAHAWCGRFVPIPTPEEVVYGALHPAGAGRALGYNATFLYPRRGGIGALANALARANRSPLRLATPVRSIAWRQRQVTLPDGSKRGYRVLVSTVPLKRLILQLLVDVPESVRAAATRLRATQVTYWNVGVARPNGGRDPHWAYFPGAEFPFYRAGSASAVLPGMTPPGHASYYVETSHPEDRVCAVTDEQVLTGLRRAHLLRDGEEPVFWERCTIDCAYTIMDHAYGEARQTILDWLASVGLIVAGRYGTWMYDSMEGGLQQGQKAALQARTALSS